jgi:ribosomal protein L13
MLIRWVWSRKPEQVTFSRGVEAEILRLATEQGKVYSNRVPLIEAANQRIKIAKLAVAVAARLHSTDKTGELIVVKKEHVSFVGEFLDRLYKSKTLGYHEFSRQQIQNVSIADEHRDAVYKMMKAEPELANIFLTYSHVRIVDIIDMLDCEREEAKHYLKELVKSKMLFKTQNGFMKSPAFTEILREIQSEMIGENDD